MSENDLIQIFEDTQRIIREDAVLRERTLKSQRDSQLFLGDYISPIRRVKGTGKIEVVESTTFQCARNSLHEFWRIAVLNFANPHEPGGGVHRGATAQEECLCRCSNLYNVLAQPYFLKHYYRYHYHECDNYFSDRLIYSPGVTVFKSDDRIPQILEKPFSVDVITCAAPYLDDFVIKEDEELFDIYISRIKNILEVAISKEVDCIILGAFGCGAFHNNPALVAKAFAKLLVREQYAQLFEKVIFAIKRSGRFCPNLYSFDKVFNSISVPGNR